MSYNKETGLYEGYIYCITNSVNEKKYIGQTTKTLKERFSRHKNCAKSNEYKQLIYYAFNKYGADKFSINEIEKIEAFSDSSLRRLLNEKEIFYISSYESIAPSGYNMNKGGQDERRRRKSPFIVQYDLSGNYIAKYSSLMEASELSGCNRCSISECCRNGITKTSNGYVFKYEGDAFVAPRVERAKRVVQYDIDGNLIKIYNSLTEAANETNTSPSKISNVYLHSKNETSTKTANGFRWMAFYWDENIPKKIGDYKSSLSKQVVARDTNGDVIGVFHSITECSRQLHISHPSISDCCLGKKASCKGISFQYLERKSA